jgi:uncharacterized protein (TIGR00369 family)
MAHILDRIVEGDAPTTGYARALRLPRPSRWEPGRVWSSWEVDPEMLTPWGAVFGGYLAALADESAGQAAFSVLEPGETFGTSDLRISPLRPIREGTITIEASVLQRGRSTIHVEVEFRSEDGTLLVKASATQVLSRTPAG